MAMSDNEYRLVVIGEGGVGKSAITVQYINAHFVELYDPTIEDSYRKQTLIDDQVALVHVLDTAGQEQFSCLRETWYRQGEGFLMAYSITDRASFLGLREHCKQLARTRDVDNLAGVPITLFANKCDLAPQRQVSKAEGEAFAAEIGARYLEGSAKQYLNINEAFEHLVRSIRVHRAPLSTNNGTNKKVVNKKQKKAGCTIL